MGVYFWVYSSMRVYLCVCVCVMGGKVICGWICVGCGVI